jgi:hypothetical protein
VDNIVHVLKGGIMNSAELTEIIDWGEDSKHQFKSLFGIFCSLFSLIRRKTAEEEERVAFSLCVLCVLCGYKSSFLYT